MTRLEDFIKKADLVEIKLDSVLDESVWRPVYEAALSSEKEALTNSLEKLQLQAVQATQDATRKMNQQDISGAIFDFAAWLICRETPITIGGKTPPLVERGICSDITDLIAEWARERGLSIENSRIAHWRESI
jgi:CHAD domain-containing protein